MNENLPNVSSEEDPFSAESQTIENPHGQRSLVGFSSWGRKDLDKTKQLSRAQHVKIKRGFPGGSDGKASARNAGDPGSIPRSGRSSREGNGNLLQHSCLENPMYGGA